MMSPPQTEPPAELREASAAGKQKMPLNEPKKVTGGKGRTRKLNIAVFGAFGSGNLGNECTLYALLANLQRVLPGSSFSTICTGPEETAARYGIPAFPLRQGRLPQSGNALFRILLKLLCAPVMELYRWFKVFSLLAGKDMLIMTGTGMLSDVGIVPMGLHYDILRWSIAARLRRCKVCFLSVGVGPIRHPLSRLFVKAALSLAHFRSYRDAFSWSYLQSINYKCCADEVYPDLAFSLPQKMVPASGPAAHPGTVVGLGVITHSRRRATSENDETIYRDYMAKLSAFAAGLLARKYRVRLLIGDVIWDQRAKNDLIATLEQMGWPCDGGSLISRPIASFEDLMAELAETDIVIASRFHNVLLSMAMSKPVVAISFHEKVDALMSAAGLQEYCQDIENIDVDRLIAQVADARANSEWIVQDMKKRAAVYREELDRQYEIVAGLSGLAEPVLS